MGHFELVQKNHIIIDSYMVYNEGSENYIHKNDLVS